MESILLNLPVFLGIIAALGFAFFIVLLVNKNDQIRTLRLGLDKMKKSFYELDEQAKLIVKTDLELNKAQEESDKRLNALNAFQKTSRLISTTLDEGEIFQRLNDSLTTDLLYKKALVIILGRDKKFRSKVALGYSDEEATTAFSRMEEDKALLDFLKDGYTFSSINCPQQRRETIIKLFGPDHFVLSPIVTQNGLIGIVFLGNPAQSPGITEGDEELVSILANQIGQSLENARLFEEVFLSSKKLEIKVQERTHQLASALEKVQNISKTKSEFISAVSHELRTPLTSIKGYAAILMAGKLGEIPDQVKERLKKINLHSDNLVKLINDLLDIARIESGRAELSFSPCDIRQIVENVGDLLLPQMKSKDINWVVDLENDLPETILDKSQIERVFINLVSNAIKFTPEKGKISIKGYKGNNFINFEVSDTGIGISQEDADRLFDEFYRVENTINQNVKGTGLGLALVKKIIEAHKGRIWIKSEIGKGTTFYFTLPPQPVKEEESKKDTK